MLGFTMVDFALVDGHCHTVYSGTPDAEALERWCSEAARGTRSRRNQAPPSHPRARAESNASMNTEADRPSASGVSYADSPIGHTLRRWCAEPLGLEPGVPLDDYLARRAELGPEESRRRLMAAAWLSDMVVDTGISGTDFASPEALGEAAEAKVHEVVRLETVAEALAGSGVRAADFAEAYVQALNDATEHAVGVKSIVAYRHGLDVDPTRPDANDVRDAANEWLTAGDTGRLDHPVLLRFLLWCAVDRGLPIQLHTGFGDRDVRLARANPALLQPFIEAVEPTGTALVLLHCYPYHREAGWLAHIYPHVYLDMGLTLSYVGPQVGAVLAEFTELAPFGKLLFSTDAYGLPELYCVGATQFRHALDIVLRRWTKDGIVTANDTERLARMFGADNARQLYGL